MASLMAPVKDGKFVETDSQNSLKNKTSGTSDMDKDTFLQLLVAQMKYQDPLEPTSNTEYISQYAQFSQVEQIQNMAATSELARATSLVGKDVYIKTTDSSGEVKYVQGKVDYVVFENGKAYLSIDEELYDLEDLDTVVDGVYQTAYDKALDFTVKMNHLPVPGGVDLTDASAIKELEEIYENMSDYEKSFLAKETVEKYQKYLEKLKEVYRQAGLDENGNKIEDPEEPGEEGGGDENVDGSGNVSGGAESGSGGDGTEDEGNGSMEGAGGA